ncbi:uncharacterized protein LOC119070963 [Bradysia coprophila]|uniref:uncharacterized protein LOC119070963 n=1 Tax=Bradysia coprophila TaxID=38358 RepID=UPI00187DD364|nr:uncharacterized protein LOC119070963 [Bradysia coprophila]
MVQPLKLVDLNEDVLEKIFSYLDIQDLVNVVNSDKEYLNSSRSAFKRKYRGTCIQMPFVSNEVDPTQQCVSNVELLRYFGESMSILEFCFDCNHPNAQRIFHLVVTYCRETLTELKMSHLSSVGFPLNKSFTKVRKLTFSRGNPNLPSSQLAEWFPSLEILVIDSIEDVLWLLKSSQKISSLKCLSIDITNEHFDRANIRDLNKFIAMNTQLNETCLSLRDYNDHHFNEPQLPNLHDDLPDDYILRYYYRSPNLVNYSTVFPNETAFTL